MKIFRKPILLILTMLGLNCIGLRHSKELSGPLTTFFSAKSQITIVNDGRVANFGADIHFTLSDSFHIKVGGPFGITAGEVFILGHRYLFLNRMDRTILHGEINDDRLQALFQIPLSGEILARLPIIPWLLRNQASLHTVFPGYVLLNHQKYSTGNIEELRLKKKEENIIFRYENFRDIGGVPIPQKIYIEIPERRQKMQMSFNKLKKQHAVFPLPPVIGEEYRQISLN